MSVMYQETLFKKDARGDIRVWTIRALDDCCLEIEHGSLGGAKQVKYEEVSENKSGRSLDEQLLLRFNSRIEKKRDAGYKSTVHEAEESRKNTLELPRPMLAVKYNSVKGRIKFRGQTYVQRKYDGNRCLIAKRNDAIIAYTRNGKQVKTIQHVLDEIDIPNDTVIDGELYVHGLSLQKIRSLISRKQPDSLKLRFHAYDMVDKQLPFIDRFNSVAALMYGLEHVEVAPTYPIGSEKEAISKMEDFREEGYEGAILRWGEQGYEDGKRSKSLVKFKVWHDMEFVVLDIEVSKDGWPVLIMKYYDREFKAIAPGTHEDRQLVLRNKEAYIGKLVTIEFANITADGVPFHPVAKSWR